MNEKIINKKNYKKTRIRDFFLISLLGGYILNFYGVGDYIPLVLFIPLIFLFAMTKKQLDFSCMLLSLIGLLTMYTLIVSFYGYDSLKAMIRLTISPISMLLLGYYSFDSTEKEARFLFFISILALFMSLFSLLALINTNAKYGNYTNAMMEMGNRRFVISYWGQELLTATGITTYLAPSLSLFPIGVLLPFAKYPIQKIIIFISFFISLYISLTLGNRTALVIIAFSLIVAIIILIYKGYLKKLFLFLLVILTTFFLAKSYITEFNNFIELILLRFRTQSLTKDSRFDTWIYVLMNIRELFVGGKPFSLPNGLAYSHNFFLDILYYGGYIPLVNSLVFMGLCSRQILVIKTDRIMKLTILLVFLGFSLVFMVEPILQGWIVSFSCFCFFMGLTSKLAFFNKKKKFN